MNPDNIRHVEINGRKFMFCKMTPKAALKIVKLLAAKILPFLDKIPFASLAGAVDGGLDDLDGFLEGLNLPGIASALDLIDDESLDKLIDAGLAHSYEQLASGPVRVINPDGTYAVAGIEHDVKLTLRLTIEAIVWSVADFFDGKGWSSTFQGMGDLFKQGV